MNDWQNDLSRRQAADAAASRVSAEIANQAYADRKHTLRIEIAKATDKLVKAELQAMLDEMEAAERKRKIVSIVALIVFIVVGLFLFFMYKNSNNKVVATHTSMSTNSISSKTIDTTERSTTSSSSLTMEQSEKTINSITQNESNNGSNNSVDTKNLTTDQIKAWVSAVVKAGGVTNNFKVDINTRDGYAYATVTNTDAQVDSMGTYRVNEKGELEEDGYYYEKPGTWIVVSPSYMDVSNIPDINNVQSQQINPISNKSLVTNFDSAVDWLKEHKENWSYSNKNSETVVITGVNESLTDLRNDELGSYYSVVVNTNDDDGGITGSTKQFKVYTNGVIQQRAGMHDFYTIYTGS